MSSDYDLTTQLHPKPLARTCRWGNDHATFQRSGISLKGRDLVALAEDLDKLASLVFAGL